MQRAIVVAVVLFLCVTGECDSVSVGNKLGQKQEVTSPSPSPSPASWSKDNGWHDGPFTEQHRLVTRNGMLFFQGVLNVLWIGTLLILHVLVDNKWLPQGTLLFLNTHIVPALNGPVQMKLVVFTNGLLALSRGFIAFLNSMWGGLLGFTLGLWILFSLYFAYLKGQKKTLKAASEVAMNAAHAKLTYQLQVDRMSSLREKLRKFRAFEIDDNREEALETLVDSYAITAKQRREFEAADSAEQQQLMQKFEVKISAILDKVISGEQKVDENFCCDLGTNPKGAVVRYWNSHKSLDAEMNRLADTEYFQQHLDHEALKDGTMESRTMRKFLLAYMQAKKNKKWTDEEAPPVSEEMGERVQFGKVSESRCCYRDPMKDGGKTCEPITRKSVIYDPNWVPDLPWSKTCEANCEFEPHTLQAFCDAVYKFRVKPSNMFYPAVFPMFMFSITFVIVLAAFFGAGYGEPFYNTLNWG